MDAILLIIDIDYGVCRIVIKSVQHAKFEGLLSICNVELYKRLSIFIRKAAALL
jgi:hypothetical protein